MIKVLKPGLATSVQDLGREGYYHLGIPPSGALDQYALSAANHLVATRPRRRPGVRAGGAGTGVPAGRTGGRVRCANASVARWPRAAP